MDLVRGGLELAEGPPVWGWGSGSFGAAFSRHIERAKTTVSHTEPITVAAEQGGIGLIVYVALVVLALIVLLSGGGRLRGDGGGGRLLRGDGRPQPRLRGASRSTRRPGRCWAWGSRCGAARPASASAAAAGAVGDAAAPRSARDPRPAAV